MLHPHTVPAYFPPHLVTTIKAKADILEVIGSHVNLKGNDTKQVGDCPLCGGKKKLNVTTTKGDNGIWKCFKCNEGGDAVSFLQQHLDISFPDALRQCAERFGVSLEELEQQDRKDDYKRDLKMSFRDQQLLSSGIGEKDQQYTLKVAEGQLEIRDRYQRGTINRLGRKWEPIAGDDMLLHYLDLQGKPQLYHPSKGHPQPYIRLRYANPELHRGKDGKTRKYTQPMGSGNHLWLPQRIIDAYKNHMRIRTLFIVEGEKKADAMCIHGMHAIGIAGIHNLSHEGAMPEQLQLLIRQCKVDAVVMVYDADWRDINAKPGKHVDHRSRSFAKSAYTFQRYFKAFGREGIDLEIYIMAHIDGMYKGIDDLLTTGIKDKEEGLLLSDFNTASQSAQQPGKGKHLEVYHATQLSSTKIYDIWHLNGFTDFAKAYKEELQEIKVFYFAGVERRYNEKSDDFELAQAIMPSERYWDCVAKKSGPDEYRFKYTRMRHFLRNHGYGRFEVRDGAFRLIHQNGRILTATNPQGVQDYVMQFTEALEEEPVLEMMLRGSTQYLGMANLNNMYPRKPQLLKPEPDAVYLAFAKTYWKITADAITEYPIAELPGYIWKEQVIDFEPELLKKPMADLTVVDGKPHIKMSKEFFQCDMARFAYYTSWENWRSAYRFGTDPEDGRQKFFAKTNTPWKDVALEDQEGLTLSLTAKMLAAGYALQPFRDYSCMKAIIAMDAKETEVGQSQGGTGKSLWSRQFNEIRQVVTIDGKKRNLAEDQFIYSNVTERTGIIVIDDCRMNFDFEHFFSQITQGITVNAKGEPAYDLDPPRFIFSTNHAMRGNGNSFERRQYYVTFTDFFNKHRTPADEFGGQLFYDWDHRQWSLFYNWMACCIQAHLRHQLNFSVSLVPIERRRIRQALGEDLLDWCTLLFTPDADDDGHKGELLNRQVSVDYLWDRCLRDVNKAKVFLDKNKLQAKIRRYAEYKGLQVCPENEGKRLKSNNTYYLSICDEHYDAQYAKRNRIKDQMSYDNVIVMPAVPIQKEEETPPAF